MNSTDTNKKYKKHIVSINKTNNIMNKRIILFLLSVLFLSSCMEDDSTYGNGSIYIDISGIESTYNVVSFSNDALEINPEVTTSFDANDLEYEWSYAPSTSGSTTTSSDSVIATVISHEKVLDYESRLSDGIYNFFFTVKSKSTGYSQSKTTIVYAASALSKGFYILKENSEGNTDVDLWNTQQQALLPDVLANYGGSAIKGTPLHLDIIGNFSYLDSISGKPASGPVLSITTQSTHDQRWIRIRDAKTVKTLADCHYEPQTDEIPYRSVCSNQTEFLITNNGIYTASAGYGIGTFGAAVYGTSGNEHATATNYYQLVFYNPQNHSLQSVDASGTTVSILNKLTDQTQMITYRPIYNYSQDIIFLGLNQLSYNDAIVFAVSQSTSDPNDRAVYSLKAGYSNISLTSVRVLDKSSHFANAAKYAICGSQARLLYAIDGNKVYSLDLSNENSVEQPVSLPGIPEGEQITYIADKAPLGVTDAFDYLIIGTQQNGIYHVYFYNMTGGIPDGNPVFSIEGHGILRNVEYTDPVAAKVSGNNIIDD